MVIWRCFPAGCNKFFYFCKNPKTPQLFSFLSKKPLLKDLIPDGYTDIHSHILPGIDDGAKTIDDTIALIQGLAKTGCKHFIATPHVMRSVWENTRENIEAKLEETQLLLDERGVDIKLRAAAEYLLDANFAEQFKNERLLTVKDNFVLVEMSYINPPIQLFDFLFELQVAGYVPILAHPERYTFYHKSFDKYEQLKNAGCYFQINLLSTVGYYGESVLKAAEKLLKSGMIDFCGSDVHHSKHVEALSKRVLIKEIAPLQRALANNDRFRL